MERARGKMGLIVSLEEDMETEGKKGTVITPSVDTPSSTDQLAMLMGQFQQTQQLLAQMGAGRFAADGSFMVGPQIQNRAQRELLGSDCTCAQCTPHNQIHWMCYVCGSGPWEWRTRVPRSDRGMPGQGNKPGKRHAVCSDRCGRDYAETLGRIPSGEPAVEHMPVDKLPRAGGDDGFGLMELNG